MDPFTALSLAGTVVQFVDFGSKLISKGHEIYKDSEASADAQSAILTKDLLDYSTKFEQSLKSQDDKQPFTDEQVAEMAQLEELSQDCRKMARDLLVRLENLKVTMDQKCRGWESFQKAFLSVWSAKELAEMQRKLSGYRKVLDSRVLRSLSRRIDDIGIQQSSRFEDLDKKTQQIVTSLLHIESSQTESLQPQLLALTQLLGRCEVVITDQEDVTRRTIVNVFQDIFSRIEKKDREVFQKIKDDESTIREAVADEIISRLHFETSKQRQEDLADAHAKTFQWIFESPNAPKSEERRWDSFVRWLEEGSGVYWINGKAGAGKSTLVKYMVESAITRRHLSAWAQNSGSECYIGSFFFWASGVLAQRSQSGLLRSLLFEILDQVPDLAPVLFPDLWASLYSAKLKSARMRQDKRWTLSTLFNAFQRLGSQTIVPVKICLFIDGLDEHDGDHQALAKLLLSVTMSGNVKVCVSSRPWNEFQELFGTCPGLRLQDLTFPDIQRYVSDNLSAGEHLEKLKAAKPLQAADLVREIVMSAEGVFLWVRLVVASLLRGLRNSDSISDLQLRLRSLPRELEQLYEHMLKTIEPLYQTSSSHLFQLMAAATEYRVEADWEDLPPLTVLCLSLASDDDENLALNAKQDFLSPSASTARCVAMDVRLRSRCAGLLEIQFGDHDPSEVDPEMKVAYLHRTVRDYLEVPQTKELLSGRQSETFSATISFLKSYILLLKAGPKSPDRAQTLIHAALTFARRAENELVFDFSPLLDEFFCSASPWFGRLDERSFFRNHGSMLTLATQCGLTRYLQTKLNNRNIIVEQGSSLMTYALVPDRGGEGEKFIDARVVQVLLFFGAKPNLAFGARTPWENALSHLNQDLSNDMYNLEEWGSIIKILLKAGADPLACGGGAPQIIRVKENGAVKTVVKEEWSVEEIITKRFVDRDLVLADLRKTLELVNSYRPRQPSEGKSTPPKQSGSRSFMKRIQFAIGKK